MKVQCTAEGVFPQPTIILRSRQRYVQKEESSPRPLSLCFKPFVVLLLARLAIRTLAAFLNEKAGCGIRATFARNMHALSSFNCDAIREQTPVSTMAD